jgi:hypothetical protein
MLIHRERRSDTRDNLALEIDLDLTAGDPVHPQTSAAVRRSHPISPIGTYEKETGECELTDVRISDLGLTDIAVIETRAGARGTKLLGVKDDSSFVGEFRAV